LPELWALRAQGGLTQVDTGYLVILAALALSAMASLILILLPVAILGPAPGRRKEMARWRVAVYFLALGFGFMFIEISFLQRFTLFLGHPLVAVAVVLAAFLVFAGFGSGISQRFAERRRLAMAIAAAAIIAFAGLHLIVLPFAFAGLIALPLYAKAAVAALLIAPLGFAMGLPFPLGLGQVAAVAPELVPWAWGINGCASVVGAVLASILAMHLGFTIVVCLALALYGVGAIVFAPETAVSDRSRSEPSPAEPLQ
jgi:hypothetical protein